MIIWSDSKITLCYSSRVAHSFYRTCATVSNVTSYSRTQDAFNRRTPFSGVEICTFNFETDYNFSHISVSVPRNNKP
jgi:hypothetical protein